MLVKELATESARLCVPAMEPEATRAASSAYSTRSWPDSSCEKRVKKRETPGGSAVSGIGSVKGVSLIDSDLLLPKYGQYTDGHTPTKVSRKRVGMGSRNAWVGRIAALGGGRDSGVEAGDDDVDAVRDFDCDAVYADDGGEPHNGCDEGILDHVLSGVFGCEAMSQCERGLE